MKHEAGKTYIEEYEKCDAIESYTIYTSDDRVQVFLKAKTLDELRDLWNTRYMP